MSDIRKNFFKKLIITVFFAPNALYFAPITPGVEIIAA